MCHQHQISVGAGYRFRFSRSLSMGALQGGQLALERLVHHHKARTVDVIDNLKKQLSEPQLDFRQLQLTISWIEANGKEEEAVKVLKKHRDQFNKENKLHEVYEIKMLLVELLIYQGKLNDALECLDDTQISEADFRGPFFKAIIGILAKQINFNGIPPNPEENWQKFVEIRSQFQYRPGSDHEVDEVASNFDKFKDAVNLLKYYN